MSFYFKKFFLITFLCALQAVHISAQSDEVDKYVRAVMLEKQIPGAAIAVVKNGKVVKSQGYGAASIEFNAVATPDTVFEIGSISKQMTAAAILLLVEDGKINLDEKISKYLFETPEAWKNVSVRNLLTHTSGIKSYTGLSGFELKKRLKQNEFIKQLSTHALEFEAGERYLYSNSGYNLLGFIIENVSGKNYWDFMRERIFQPLKMNQTADRDPQFIIRHRANGYEWRGNRLVGRDYDLTDIFSAGAIVSTINDLTKWEAALRGDNFLKKESKIEMWTPAMLNGGITYPYGLGWRISDIRGHKLIAHSGQTAGFGASIARFTDDDITVIVLTNLGEIGLGTLLAHGIAKIYIPAISLKALKAKPEPDAKISRIAAVALKQRLKNEFSTAIFSASLANSLSNERSRVNNLRIASFGETKNLVFAGDEIFDGKRIFRYKAETDKRIFLWRLAFDDEGIISEMTLEEEE